MTDVGLDEYEEEIRISGIADRDIRVLDLDTGELIRRLTLDPSRDYQPIGGG